MKGKEYKNINNAPINSKHQHLPPPEHNPGI